VLPKNNRLKKNEDIQRVFQKGKRCKEDFLILKKLSNDLNQVRFAFVVSRKLSKKASLRNKVKRNLRESVKKRLNKIQTKTDVVVIALPGLEKKSFLEIEESIDKLLRKAKLLVSKP
jgi:ribonuclease P protein component